MSNQIERIAQLRNLIAECEGYYQRDILNALLARIRAATEEEK
jgi:hypothetical protein